MKKRIKVLIILSAAVIAVALTAVFIILPMVSVFPAINLSALTNDQKNTLASLQRIDDHPLYIMKYYGDYSEFLGLKEKYFKQLGIPKPECTTITALAGDKIVGYNSDRENEPLLLLYTDIPDGYSSASIVHLRECFGFGFTSNTPLDSEQNKALLLYSPYFCATGMNEMGFAITGMAAPDSSFPAIDPKKESKFSSEMYRYLLDHAKDCADAVQMLEEYNVGVPPSSGAPTHWMIADASGHSAIIEWVGGEIRVVWNKENWQVATNFSVYGAEEKTNTLLNEYRQSGQITNDINGISYLRYATAWEELKKAGGNIDPREAMDILKSVSLTKNKEKEIWYDTIYSIVYDLSSRSFRIALDKDFDHAVSFTINDFPGISP